MQKTRECKEKNILTAGPGLVLQWVQSERSTMIVMFAELWGSYGKLSQHQTLWMNVKGSMTCGWRLLIYNRYCLICPFKLESNMMFSAWDFCRICRSGFDYIGLCSVLINTLQQLCILHFCMFIQQLCITWEKDLTLWYLWIVVLVGSKNWSSRMFSGFYLVLGHSHFYLRLLQNPHQDSCGAL